MNLNDDKPRLGPKLALVLLPEIGATLLQVNFDATATPYVKTSIETKISASTAVTTSCLFFNASLFEHSEFDALKNKQLVVTAVEALIAHSKSGSRVVMTSCSFCTQGKSKLWLKVK